MQKALAYARFSSDEQKDGDSLNRQTNNLTLYAERYGFSIEKTIFDEGKSAYKGEHLSNGNLGKLLAEAEKGSYRGYAFLVEEQDRLSRQGILATLTIFKRILDAGIEIHVTEKNLIVRCYEDLDNLAIAIPTVVNGSTANEYTKKLSARLLSARAAERAKAREDGLATTARVPAWLKAEVGKKAEVIPEHAATVQLIFRLAALNLGAKRITRSLEEEGRKPFGDNRAWSPEYVQKILRNRAVLGEYQPHKLVTEKRRYGKEVKTKVRVKVGEPIFDYYPPVVSPSEWKAARDQVEAKTRFKRKDGRPGFAGGNDNPNSLFSPLVFDIDNGVPMRHNPGKKTGKKGDYPRLESRWRSGKRAHSLRLEQFEELMLEVLADFDWQAIAGESESPEIKAAQTEFDAVLSEIDRHNLRLASLEKLVEEGAFSKSLFEAIDAEKLALGDYTAKRESIATALAEARSKVAALHDPEKLIAAIRSGNAPEPRLRLKAEIRLRIAKIEVTFADKEEDKKVPAAERLDYCVFIRFINGALRAIGVKDGKALLAEVKLDPELLRKLDKAHSINLGPRREAVEKG
jgi:DNA invertase Pin-like site-specific DNA recombinase